MYSANTIKNKYVRPAVIGAKASSRRSGVDVSGKRPDGEHAERFGMAALISTCTRHLGIVVLLKETPRCL